MFRQNFRVPRNRKSRHRCRCFKSISTTMLTEEIGSNNGMTYHWPGQISICLARICFKLRELVCDPEVEMRIPIFCVWWSHVVAGSTQLQHPNQPSNTPDAVVNKTTNVSWTSSRHHLSREAFLARSRVAFTWPADGWWSNWSTFYLCLHLMENWYLE